MVCKRGSLGEDLRKAIKPYAHTRAEKKLGRVLVDLGAHKMVESIKEKRYTVVVATIFRGIRGCSFCHKLDATEHIETFLLDTPADCALFKVALV